MRLLRMRLTDDFTSEDVTLSVSITPMIQDHVSAMKDFLIVCGFHKDLINEFIPEEEYASPINSRE